MVLESARCKASAGWAGNNTAWAFGWLGEAVTMGMGWMDGCITHDISFSVIERLAHTQLAFWHGVHIIQVLPRWAEGWL
jgi:hypothetical protein